MHIGMYVCTYASCEYLRMYVLKHACVHAPLYVRSNNAHTQIQMHAVICGMQAMSMHKHVFEYVYTHTFTGMCIYWCVLSVYTRCETRCGMRSLAGAIVVGLLFLPVS